MALQAAIFALGITREAAAFPTSRLVYARAPGIEECPDQEAVRKAVTSRLGYDPFFPTSDKTIIAKISRDADHLKGQVELIDEHGVELGLREFSAKAGKCSDLIRAMALSISIAIDPNSAETYAKGPPDEPVAESPASAPETPAPAVAAPEPKRAPSALRETPKTVAWSAGFAALGLFGSAPTSTVGGLGFAAGRSGAWSLALEGRAAYPVTDEPRGVNVRVFSAALDVAPCLHVGPLFACELTSFGWLDARGTQLAARGGTSVFFTLGGRLGGELPLSQRFSLFADAELQANPWPIRLYAASGTLWQAPVVTGALGIGGAFHF